MKKITLLKSMLLLCALIVGSTSVWAKDAPYLALTFPDDNNANNHVGNYTSTWTAKTGTFEWSIAKFNNNNWGSNWRFIRCGTGSASTATITTSSTIDKAIRYVAVTVDATKNCTSNKLEVASNSTFTENKQTITGETLAAGVVRYYIPNPAENMYYRLTFEQKKGSNGDTQISQVAYCITTEADDAEPEAVNTTPKVWDFSSSAAQSAAGTITANATTTLTATNGTSNVTYVAGGDDTFEASSKGYYLKPGGKSGMSGGKPSNRYFVLNIAESGVLKLTSNTAKSGEYLIYQGSENDITKSTQQTSIITNLDKLTASGEIDIANGEYVFIGFNTQIYTEKLTWMIPDGISFTTTDNMDGWRTFYDATQDYEVDANTKIYVAKSATASTVELTQKDDATKIPQGEAVILKTSAVNHKMVLTKTTGATTLGDDNLLKAATGIAIDGYRLGYGNIGGENAVGFFKYDGTPAAGTVYIDSGDVTTSARELGISFGDDVTAINKVEAKKVENGVFYNLAGQQVAQPTKGLYIVNGKKVVLK